MFEIKITANSPAELQTAVFGLADSFGLRDNSAPAPVVSEPDSAVVGTIPEKKPRKPRATGAARKSELQARVSAKPEPVVEAPPATAQIERSSVENAARAFAAKFGVAKAKEILNAFGAGRVTEVPDDRLNDLYDAIQSASA
jgi:hypothetical protein